MSENICRFLPKKDTENGINIINFVYETNEEMFDRVQCDSVYKMCLVTNGKGFIETLGRKYPLNMGDVFFIFPATRYTVRGKFEYMYISYLGLRAAELSDKLNITRKNFIFRDIDGLDAIWKASISDEKSVLSLRCEGLMLYTFSLIGERELKGDSARNDAIMQIKKYVDENFSDEDLSIEKISEIFSYNPKYISSAFKKKVRVTFTKYITTLRIQKACTLVDMGFTSIKDIAYQCGYSDPFYFSKVFKLRMGLSPKEYIKNAAAH